MMYCEKLVACIKVNGKIIREDGDKVYLPFGCDYSIYLKNLNTTKCKIKIEIDGKDVLDGHSILLDGNNDIELKGFLDGNKAKNKFRFIEKTAEISNFRGDNPEDGLIVITYQFANCKQFITTSNITTNQPQYYNTNHWVDYNYRPPYTTCGSIDDNVTYCSTVNNNIMSNVRGTKSADGITVKGKPVEQNFNEIYDFNHYGEEKRLIIQLFGHRKKKKVDKIITTQTKIQCENCGRKYKSNKKYCSNCGTCLI